MSSGQLTIPDRNFNVTAEEGAVRNSITRTPEESRNMRCEA